MKATQSDWRPACQACLDSAQRSAFGKDTGASLQAPSQHNLCRRLLHPLCNGFDLRKVNDFWRPRKPAGVMMHSWLVAKEQAEAKQGVRHSLASQGAPGGGVYALCKTVLQQLCAPESRVNFHLQHTKR